MKQHWNNVQYDLYFTLHDIRNLLIDKKSREAVIQYYSKLSPVKAYFECAHPLNEFPLEAMRSIIATFKQHHIASAGALLPTRHWSLCFNNAEDLTSLKNQSIRLAKLFDEIIVDDWLFTVCTCPKCVKARGKSSWADYRSKTVVKKSRELIINAAKKANPKVSIIIKFPNWYEGHHHNGYALKEQIAQFDKYCTGIETREPITDPQHIPIYMGYFLQQWEHNIAPKRHTSCWYDNSGMVNQQSEYVAQAYQAILGGSRELILWSGGTHYHTSGSAMDYRAVVPHFPLLDKLAGILPRDPVGIDTYVPPGSDGEYCIFGYLGMIGLPINPVIEFPQSSDTCLLTLHSAHDKNLAAKIIKRLMTGKNVVVTLSLFNALRKTDIGNALQIIEDDGNIVPDNFSIVKQTAGKWDKITVPAGGKFPFKKIRLTTWPYVQTISAVTDHGNFPIVASPRYLNGTLFILNIPENYSDLFRLPVEVLNGMRRIFFDDFGIAASGKSKISLYVYNDKKLLVLYNMNPTAERAGCIISAKMAEAQWTEIFKHHMIKIKKEGDTAIIISTELKPYEIAVISRE